MPAQPGPSSSGKSYESIYLRESYRDGTHVRKRNIAHLTHCDPKESAAIELALRHKNDLTALASLEQIELHQGPFVGVVWTVYQVAKRWDLHHILGENFSAQLALWQVLARVLEQGSRLSAVRLVAVHAASAVLGWQRGFDENDLYDNLTCAATPAKTPKISLRRPSFFQGEHSLERGLGVGPATHPTNRVDPRLQSRTSRLGSYR